MSQIILKDITEIKIRFSEVDSMGVVWHGNYVKFMEDGRESFGKKFGLEYMDVYNAGYFTPIVKMNLNYKRPLKYDESAQVETVYIDDPAAVIRLKYIISQKDSGLVALEAETTQAFVNSKLELSLTIPDFYYNWKKKHGLFTGYAD